MRGSSDSAGSWNTSWTLPFGGRALPGASPGRLNRTVPDEGSMSPTTMRPTVVLPEPLSPTRPSVSPGAMENDTSLMALTTLRDPAIGKLLVKALDCQHRELSASPGSDIGPHDPAQVQPTAVSRRGRAAAPTDSGLRRCRLRKRPAGGALAVALQPCRSAGLCENAASRSSV